MVVAIQTSWSTFLCEFLKRSILQLMRGIQMWHMHT